MVIYLCYFFFFFNDTATTEIYTLSLHDALPIFFNYIINRTISHLLLPHMTAITAIKRTTSGSHNHAHILRSVVFPVHQEISSGEWNLVQIINKFPRKVMADFSVLPERYSFYPLQITIIFHCFNKVKNCSFTFSSLERIWTCMTLGM